MQRRSYAVLAALTAVLLLPSRAGAVPPPPAASLSVQLGVGARLGEPISVRLRLRLDRHRAAVARRLSIRYPAGLDLIGSGLGLEPCLLPSTTFAAVVVDSQAARAGCPANAVVATGRVGGEVRLPPLAIRERTAFTLLAGALQSNQLGLVALVDGLNPLGGTLAYDAALIPSRGRFGGRISIAIPRLPDLPYDDADVALLDVDATIGSSTITYSRRDRAGRLRRWHPEGPILPSDCRHGGLPFAVEVVLSDGATVTATTSVACPTARRSGFGR